MPPMRRSSRTSRSSRVRRSSTRRAALAAAPLVACSAGEKWMHSSWPPLIRRRSATWRTMARSLPDNSSRSSSSPLGPMRRLMSAPLVCPQSAAHRRKEQRGGRANRSTRPDRLPQVDRRLAVSSRLCGTMHRHVPAPHAASAARDPPLPQPHRLCTGVAQLSAPDRHVLPLTARENVDPRSTRADGRPDMHGGS
ncbi:MAG: hypothetical protein JWM34_470 [Ilumatobacteraceae bacterium]|nr:hypothetical protein [Ilumatobacteraceae bacterium]